MRKLFILLCLFALHCLFSELIAQQVNHLLIAKVKNESDSLPIPYANVILLDGDSLLIKGTLTDESGNFKIDNSDLKGKQISVSFLGYEPAYISVTHIPKNIYLKPTAINLQEVHITGHRQYVKTLPDRLMISMESNPIAQLGTAHDALKQMPMIDGSSGGIQVIGRGTPEIYINNRMVRNQEELKRLSSNDIKDIQIITHPDSQYGGNVTSVILIRTRRHIEGLSGTIYAQVQRTEVTSGNTSADFNYSFKNGLTLFGGINYANNTFSQKREYHELFNGNKLHTDSYQKAKARTNQWNANTGVLFDYEENSIGLRYEIEKEPNSKFHSNGEEFTNASTHQNMLSDYQSNSDSYNHHFNAYLSKKMNDEATIQVDADYIFGNNTSTGNLQESSSSSKVSFVTTENKNDYKLAAVRGNINLPLWEGTFNGGIHYSFTRNKQNFQTAYEGETPNLQPSNDKETQHLCAVYLSYEHSISNNWKTGGGLRYEMTNFTYFSNENKVDMQSRVYKDWLPELHVNWQKNSSSVGLSYQAKVSRPNYSLLNTNYAYVSHTLWETGNPMIQSSLTHDLSLNLSWKQWIMNISYLRRLRSIQSVYTYQKDLEINVRADQNLPSYNACQITLYKDFNIGIWHPSVQGLLALQDLKYGVHEKQKYNKPLGRIIVNNRFDLPAAIHLYLSGIWLSKGHDGLYYSHGGGMLNLICSKNFGRWDLNLSASDFINTWRQKNSVHTNGVAYDYNIKGASRGISISVSYRFNKAKHCYKGNSVTIEELNRLK